MGDDRASVYWAEDRDRWVFRASALSRCAQSLVAAGLGYEPMAPPDYLRRAWDEGHAGEAAVLEMFCAGPARWDDASPAINQFTVAAKWKLLDPRDPGSYAGLDGGVRRSWLDDDQFTMEVNVGARAVIRGHLDGIVRRYQGTTLVGELAVVEAKLFGPDYLKKWRKLGMAGFADYALQLSLYMRATGLPAYFVVGEKVRWGEDHDGFLETPEHLRFDVASVHVTYFAEPPVSIASAKARVMSLVPALEANDRSAMPACDVKQFPCEFFPAVCDERIVELVSEADAPVMLVDEVGAQVEAIAETLATLADEERELKRAKDNAKAELDSVLAAARTTDNKAGKWETDRFKVTWVEEEVPGGTYERKPYVKSYPKITRKKVEVDE